MTVRFRQAVRRSPPEDPQQYLLYRMEAEAIGARGYARLTRDASRRLARSVCTAFKVPQVKMEFKDFGPWAGEYALEGVIRLNPKYLGGPVSLLTVLHELGHHVHEALVPDNFHEAHGPQFMAAYMSVLDQARVIPVVAMRAVCDAYGIRYNDPGVRNSFKSLLKALQAPS